jgi:hypothetical protein
MPKTPECLAGLAHARSDTEACDALLSVLVDRRSADDINNGSAFKNNCTASYLKLSNWCSTGACKAASTKRYWGAVEPAETFFKVLFDEARWATSTKTVQTQLSRSDLFHGHIVYNNDHGVFIVFHAKEYPADIEVAKSGFARQVDPLCVSFNKDDECFKLRNAVYSMATEEWEVVTQKKGTGFGDALTVEDGVPVLWKTQQEGWFGIMDINYFPREYPHVIFA